MMRVSFWFAGSTLAPYKAPPSETKWPPSRPQSACVLPPQEGDSRHQPPLHAFPYAPDGSCRACSFNLGGVPDHATRWGFASILLRTDLSLALSFEQQCWGRSQHRRRHNEANASGTGKPVVPGRLVLSHLRHCTCIAISPSSIRSISASFTPSTLAQYFTCIRVFLAFVHSTTLSVGEDRHKRSHRTSIDAHGSFLVRPRRPNSLVDCAAGQPARQGLRIPATASGAQRSLALASKSHSSMGKARALLSKPLRGFRFFPLGCAHQHIQRIKVDQLSLTSHALRGSCWATKTTQPPRAQ